MSPWRRSSASRPALTENRQISAAAAAAAAAAVPAAAAAVAAAGAAAVAAVWCLLGISAVGGSCSNCSVPGERQRGFLCVLVVGLQGTSGMPTAEAAMMAAFNELPLETVGQRLSPSDFCCLFLSLSYCLFVLQLLLWLRLSPFLPESLLLLLLLSAAANGDGQQLPGLCRQVCGELLLLLMLMLLMLLALLVLLLLLRLLLLLLVLSSLLM